MDGIVAELEVFIKDKLKMEEKFCQNELTFGVIKPVAVLIVMIKKLIDKKFPGDELVLSESFLVLCGKLFYRLYQVSAFYNKSHSPSLFLTLTKRNQEFRFCAELGRSFERSDIDLFKENGKVAANFYKDPFEPPVEYEVYALNSNNEKKKSLRYSNTFVYRAVETSSETKYNNKVTARTKKKVYKELMPNFFAYLVCCKRDNKFKHVSFRSFCSETSVFRYLLSHYQVNDHADIIDNTVWIDNISNEMLRQLGIRYLNDIRDGSVLLSHTGGKRVHSEMDLFMDDNESSSIDSGRSVNTVKVDNLNSLMILAEVATS